MMSLAKTAVERLSLAKRELVRARMSWLSGLGWCIDRLPDRLRYRLVLRLICALGHSAAMRRELLATPHVMQGALERAALSIRRRLQLKKPMLHWPASQHLRAIELANGAPGGVLLGAHLSTNLHVLGNLEAQNMDVAFVSLEDGASHNLLGVTQIMPSTQMYFAIRQQVRKGAWVLLTLDQFNPFPGAYKMPMHPQLTTNFAQSLYLQSTAIPALSKMNLPLMLMFSRITKTGLIVELNPVSEDPDTALNQYVTLLNHSLLLQHELTA